MWGISLGMLEIQGIRVGIWGIGVGMRVTEWKSDIQGLEKGKNHRKCFCLQLHFM